MESKFKLLNDFNKNMNFTKEKQQLIKEIYEPLIEKKTSRLTELKNTVSELNKSISDSEKEVISINKNILLLKDKLSVLESIFFKRL